MPAADGHVEQRRSPKDGVDPQAEVADATSSAKQPRRSPGRSPLQSSAQPPAPALPDDAVSLDDEIVEEGAEIGQAVIERMLGGTVLGDTRT